VGEQCCARTPDENAIWRGEVNRKGVTGGALCRDAPPDMSMEANPPTFNKWGAAHKSQRKNVNLLVFTKKMKTVSK
jgi:hypothetical protein